jgi:predicted RNA-binding protein with PUA-like domain
MARACWIVKPEPSDYVCADRVRDNRTGWTAVRGCRAHNHRRTLQPATSSGLALSAACAPAPNESL